jgi:GntR family transcriptional regulator, arabinose operon transcriptional repressor
MNPKPPKHQQLSDTLEREVLEGKYAAGQKFPSEAALVTRFGVSRITVGHAVRELQRRGLVERRAGSGTYVRGSAPPGRGGLLFGLLIPNLGETEIFEPICRGMASAPEAANHALLWGNAVQNTAEIEEEAWQLCRQYIARPVSGVFFAPLELTPGKDGANLGILSLLEQAEIPIVLLDRCVLPYPDRSPHDLVGIDNRRAGYIITRHLLQLGCRRILFAAYTGSAPTVEARVAGYREALFVHDAPVEGDLVAALRPGHEGEIEAAIRAAQPDAIVCANDRTAGRVMHVLLNAGFRIPRDIRIAGIDDVAYASLLPVPLTTVRQPCREIGEAAIAAMLERIARPEMPVRDILLDSRLIVRQSCGAIL